MRLSRRTQFKKIPCPSISFTFWDTFIDMLISKELGNLNETPWHQDFSYSQMPSVPEDTLIENHSLPEATLYLLLE